MNINIFLGALLVFLGNIVTTLPHLRSALHRRQLVWWRQVEGDESLGNARVIASSIKQRMENNSGATITEWCIMFCGVIIGICGAVLMSFPP
jgi:hypothetical protein